MYRRGQLLQVRCPYNYQLCEPPEEGLHFELGGLEAYMWETLVLPSISHPGDSASEGPVSLASGMKEGIIAATS